jgi:hypothetical protein
MASKEGAHGREGARIAGRGRARLGEARAPRGRGAHG